MDVIKNWLSKIKLHAEHIHLIKPIVHFIISFLIVHNLRNPPNLKLQNPKLPSFPPTSKSFP